MMQKVFANECMSKTRIKEWYKRFKGDRTSVDSDSRSGRLSTTKTLDNIDRVRLAIEGDRRLTVREPENDVRIPNTVARYIDRTQGKERCTHAESTRLDRVATSLLLIRFAYFYVFCKKYLETL